MTNPNLYNDWQALCSEHESAKNAYFQAFATVNQKFMGIAQTDSRANPTENELSEFESTWQAWEGVKQRMAEFVKRNT